MRRRSVRRLHLRNRLLAVSLFVFVGSEECCRAWVQRRYKKEKELGGSAWCFIENGPPGAATFESVIWMPYFRKGNAFDAGKLAHEVLHIAWRLLERLGVFDEETHCYLVQWIVEETTRHFTGAR